LKAEKKGSGKKGEEKKSDELSVAEVKGKVDPNAKTLDEYQKERKEKKTTLLSTFSSNVQAPVEKKETKKKEEEKKGILSDLFVVDSNKKKDLSKKLRKFNSLTPEMPFVIFLLIGFLLFFPLVSFAGDGLFSFLLVPFPLLISWVPSFFYNYSNCF